MTPDPADPRARLDAPDILGSRVGESAQRAGYRQPRPMFRTPPLGQSLDSGLERTLLTSLPSAILGSVLLVVSSTLASRRHARPQMT